MGSIENHSTVVYEDILPILELGFESTDIKESGIRRGSGNGRRFKREW